VIARGSITVLSSARGSGASLKGISTQNLIRHLQVVTERRDVVVGGGTPRHSAGDGLQPTDSAFHLINSK
jgi:hypothetical protein